MSPKNIDGLRHAKSSKIPPPSSPSKNQRASKRDRVRVKAPNISAKKDDTRCRFLKDLPGEVRNQIYEYAVGHVYLADKSFRFWTGIDQGLKLWLPRDLPIFPHLNQCSRANLESSLWPVDLPCTLAEVIGYISENLTRPPESTTKVLLYKAGNRYQSTLGHEIRRTNAQLLFVCRQIHQEVLSVVYSRVTFAFGSLASLRKTLIGEECTVGRNFQLSEFIPTMKPLHSAKLPFLTSLHLECQAYGPAPLTKDFYWKRRYYASWTVACSEIVDNLPALKNLRLAIVVPNENPTRLLLTDQWVMPFLQFSRCDSLKEVQVLLASTSQQYNLVALWAFADVMCRKIRGWDDASALEAIDYYKDRIIKSNACGMALFLEMEALGRDNGLVTATTTS